MQCRWVYHNNKKQIVQFVWLLNAMVLLLLVCLYGCRCGFAVKKYSTTICAVVWIQTLISSSPANHSTTQLQYISSSRISFSFVLDSWDFSCPPSPRNSDLSGGFMVYPGKYKSNCRRSKCTYVRTLWFIWIAVYCHVRTYILFMPFVAHFSICFLT